MVKLASKAALVLTYFFHLQTWALDGLPAGEILLSIRKSEKLNAEAPKIPNLSMESWDPTAMPHAMKSWLQMNIPRDEYLQLIRNISSKTGEALFP